jgi:8-hydroxy-5-deazaflavin:NADPH oxidoreductase
LFRGLGTSVDGKTVIDATNHVNLQNPGEVLGATSNAEEIQKRHPKVHVVKAFNYAFAARMAEPTLDGVPIDGFVAGDDEAAKAKAMEFVGSIGFHPVDAGPLVMARALEAMAILIISLRVRSGWSRLPGWKMIGAAKD